MWYSRCPCINSYTRWSCYSKSVLSSYSKPRPCCSSGVIIQFHLPRSAPPQRVAFLSPVASPQAAGCICCCISSCCESHLLSTYSWVYSAMTFLMKIMQVRTKMWPSTTRMTEETRSQRLWTLQISSVMMSSVMMASYLNMVTWKHQYMPCISIRLMTKCGACFVHLWKVNNT